MKHNRVQFYLLWLLGGGLLVSCTAGTVEEIVPEESRPVTLSFGRPDLGVPVVLTRTGETATPDPVPLPEGTTVRIGAYFTGDVGDKPATASFSTTAPSFEATYAVGADGVLYPCRVDDEGNRIEGEATELTVRGGRYDFYAVSPARRLEKGQDDYYRITGVPHKEDVMVSFVRDVAVTKASRRVTLGTFNRKCALVVFHVVPSEGNALSFNRLCGTRLELKKISSTAANLVVGEDTGFSQTGGEAGEGTQILFNEDEFDSVEQNSDPDNIGLNKTKGIILPKNNRPFDVEITVERDNEPAILKATINENIAFEEGKRYIFTLEVTNEKSRLVMRVMNWNTIYFTDNTVGAPDIAYPDPDINQGIGTPVTIAEWAEI